MCLQHLLQLVVVLRLNHLDQCLLVVLELVLVQTAPLLQLLQRYLELLLRLHQVPLICLLLRLQELTLPLPKRLVTVVCRLQVGQIPLQVLHLRLHFQHIFRMGGSVEIGGTCGRVQGLDLDLQIRDFLLVVLFHLSLLFL